MPTTRNRCATHPSLHRCLLPLPPARCPTRYSGNFCDSVGELYDCFTARGATVVGFTDQDGYDHYDSKAIRDDKFCGLMCDEQNQMDQSEDRATAWVEQLKAEGMPL